jgi:hypothetical protein
LMNSKVQKVKGVVTLHSRRQSRGALTHNIF